MANIFGDYLKKLRLERGLTLRLFCEKNRLDPGNYSKLERGIFLPPTDEKKLDVYREALNLSPDSEEWQELYRLAFIGRGEIPMALLENVGLVNKLPALFRKLESASEEELDNLIATLKGQ